MKRPEKNLKYHNLKYHIIYSIGVIIVLPTLIVVVATLSNLQTNLQNEDVERKIEATLNHGDGNKVNVHVKGTITSYDNYTATISTQILLKAQDCQIMANAPLGRGRFGTSEICSKEYWKEQIMVFNTDDKNIDISKYYGSKNDLDLTYSCYNSCLKESDKAQNCCFVKSIKILNGN